MSEPNKIDQIRKEKNKLILAMTEHRNWNEDPDMKNQFFAKARMYLGWLQTDDFQKSYPNIETKNVIIELICQYKPSNEILQLINKMNELTKSKSGVKIRYSLLK